MASNITLSYFGPPEQKHVVKVPPMQTLLEALQAASSKFKPALVPQQCALQYNKKPVDLNTPFRLLNVPAGSKLEVIINKPLQAGASSGPASTAAAAPQQQVAGPSAPAAPPAAAVAPAAAGQPAETAATVQAQPAASSSQPPAPAAPTAPPPATPVPPAPSEAGPSASAAAGAGPSSAAVMQEGSAAAAAAAEEEEAGPSRLASLGVSGPVYVFHQRTLEAAAAQGPKPMDVDPPDDFFELTPDDLVRIQQQAKDKKRQEGVFRPRAMREAEEAARAASLGPIRVRLHFPDATIVQATFKASQPLSAVQQLVTQLSLDPVGPALYLYTTPPKTVLKDPTASLYQMKLVPAAHLYVGCEVKRLKPAAQAAVVAGVYPGPYLRPEVLALLQDSLPEQQHEDQKPQLQAADYGSSAEASAADAQRAMAAAAAASRAGSGSGRGPAAAGDGAKVPKWLKTRK